MSDTATRFHNPCKGPSRREILRVGAIGLGGLTLADLLQLEAAQGKSSKKSVIMIYLCGAPPHQDMFDLKPEAPAEIRGEFKPIHTNVNGIQVCEHLPRLARIMDKLVPIRTVVGSPDGDHDSFICYTGRSPRRQPAGNWPSVGAVASRLLGPSSPEIPPFVGLAPKAGHPPYGSPGHPGFVGPAHSAFRPFGESRGDMVLDGITLDRFRERRSLLTTFDQVRREIDMNGQLEVQDSFKCQALDLLTSSRFANALDLSKESQQTRDRYGKGDPKNYGDGAPRNLEHFLLARRLVEAGARVVTLNFGRWDFHSNNFSEFKNTHAPYFDQGVSALVEDLHQRGLDQDVAVIAWGEFGRTPIINKDAGRDHWPQVGCGLFAGGGMKMGQAIGRTDRIAGVPVDRPVHFGEVIATLYHHLGIDPHVAHVQDLTGRPQYLVDHAHHPLRELI